MAEEKTVEDIVLISRTLQGQKEAFAQLINRYKNCIFNLVYRTTGNYADAEDTSQEVFLQAYKKLRDYRPAFRFRNWLYTIALNICRNKLKKEGRLEFISLDKPVKTEESEVYLQIPDRSPTPEESLITEMESKRISEMIHALPLKYRDVFLLRYTEGLTYEEISRVAGLSLGTVEARLFRARRLLMKSLNLWKKFQKV